MSIRAPSSPIFIPDLCGIRAVFVLVIIGELLALILTLTRVGISAAALNELAVFSWYVQAISLTAAAALCLSRPRLSRLPDPWVALLSYGLVMIVIAAASELVWRGVTAAFGTWGVLRLTHADFLVRTLGISAIVVALILRYFYIQFHWQQRIASEGQARLQALQARIRPHFLFNSMNTIASLTRTDPGRAERAVEDLADLFRASLSDGRGLVSVADEFELARRYLDIESLRIGPRLAITWDVDALPPAARIPQLTLQPLLENAVYHGIEPLAAGGTIVIEGFATATDLEIRITNPTGTASSRHVGHGVAQDNVRQRLAAHFGNAGRLVLEPSAATYCVRIQFPREFEQPAWRRDS